MQLNVDDVNQTILPVYPHTMLQLINVNMMMMFVIHGFIVMVTNFNVHFNIISYFLSIGTDVGAIRGCISIASPEYSLIKDVIGDKNAGCVKRVRGLDCFSFCTTNLCN
jgi:hypothetical protein